MLAASHRRGKWDTQRRGSHPAARRSGQRRVYHERVLTLSDLRSLPREERERIADALTAEELTALLYDWEMLARAEQLPPPGDWYAWLILAGRGFGKTRAGAEAVRLWARSRARVNIIGPTADDLRDIMVEGESGILACCPPGERPKYEPSKRRLTWPSGCLTLLLSADEPDRIRGKQCEALWADEVATWRHYESWDQAMLGLRLGNDPRAVVTTTPKPVRVVKELVVDPRVVVTRGTTYDNRANLSAKFYAQIITKYEGTRLGRQELMAELLTDNPGALWRHDEIEALRVTREQYAQVMLARAVVGLDPAVTSKETSDMWGIVGAAADARHPQHYYVFDDLSAVLSPERAAETSVALYKRKRCDRIIGEVNNGGDLIETVLRTKDLNFAYRAVHASRGKRTRAEPVAALYEQGRVHHVGCLAALEDEMCEYDPAKEGPSPNRMDALVWAITDLVEHGGAFGVGAYLREEEQRMNEAAKARLNMAKPATAPQTPACPQCGSVAVARVAGGYRCNACGHQWGGATVAAGGPSRADVLK